MRRAALLAGSGLLALLSVSATMSAAEWTAEQAIRNVIPTPQRIGEPEGWLSFGDEALVAIRHAAAPSAQDAIAGQAVVEAIQRAGGNARIVDRKDFKPGESPYVLFLYMAEVLTATGVTKDQIEQLYQIAPTADGRGIMIQAPFSLGSLYGAMTLCQMIVPHEGTAGAPRVSIGDYPDIAYRWGGSGAFLGLDPKANVDWCMAHKINLLPSPIAYQYSTANLEGQLALNRYARQHGVRILNLIFGDLGTRNRRSYPDGETYLCMDERRPSNRGWCMTGEALMAEKRRKLTEFVEATEPGCLYIHFVDEDDLGDSTEVWSNRCDECRKAYPNDNVWAEDGKAGAQARVFDAYCDAVLAVRHDESGYNAARDCLIIFVSCPYTVWGEDDVTWDHEVEYHCTVSRLMRHVDNVHFCIRENGRRRDNGKQRCLELAQALRRRGNGHQVMMYYLSGDSRHTRVLWPRPLRVSRRLMAGPAMTKAFDGAGSILEAGTSDPLLKVEYSWNLEGDGFFLDPPTDDEWRKTFVGLVHDSLRPPEVVSEQGFAGRLCRHRYGPEAGPAMLDFYVPRPSDGEGISEGARGNELLPAPGDLWLRLNDAVWPTIGEPRLYLRMAEYCQAQVARNVALLDQFGAAMFADHIPAVGMAHMETLVGGLSVGAEFGRAQSSAAEAAAALLEGKAEATDAAWEEALRSLNAAEETAGAEQKWIDSVARRRKALSGFISQMRKSAPELRERARALSDVREGGAELRAALADSLRGEAGERAVSLDHLKGATIAFRGGMTKLGALSELLRAAGAQCKDVSGPPLAQVLGVADVICFPATARTLGLKEASMLLRYVNGGGGICLAGGAPFFLCGNNVDLTPIAAWLGAERYGNYSGPVIAAGDTALTAGLEMDESMTPPGKGSACLTSPLHGLPVLIATPNSRLISAMVCRQGHGRSAFVWSLGIDSEASGARKELVMRIFAWLCGARKVASGGPPE